MSQESTGRSLWELVGIKERAVGHIPILKHAIQCSPRHELVDLRTYLE